ncbi:unnamed protein product [Tenebrio molitor]|nr:unnamed protein product [Tenebrio molitor]
MLFHCSAKESRLQELYEFPESAPHLVFNFRLHKNYYIYTECVVSRGQPFKHGFSDAYQVI